VRVTLRLFALARERAGRPEVELELPETATAADLRQALALACPALAEIVPSLLIAVDSEYADDAHRLSPGAELAAFPPVSGGGGTPFPLSF
jgi:molybdopterin converting factor subunit 1